MREIKFRLIKDGKIVGYERYVHCDQREGYIKGKSLVPQHSKDGIHWDYIYSWEMKTQTKGYWFEAQLDMDVYIEHDGKELSVGLKDKNGKEIYEGDKLIDDVGDIGIVRFGKLPLDKSGDCVCTYHAYYVECLGQLGQAPTWECVEIGDWMEIIGNIHSEKSNGSRE